MGSLAEHMIYHSLEGHETQEEKRLLTYVFLFHYKLIFNIKTESRNRS